MCLICGGCEWLCLIMAGCGWNVPNFGWLCVLLYIEIEIA